MEEIFSNPGKFVFFQDDNLLEKALSLSSAEG